MKHLVGILSDLPIDKIVQIKRYNGKTVALCTLDDCTNQARFEVL